MPTPERSCIPAATRSNPSCISADCRLPTAACILAPSIASFIVSGCLGNNSIAGRVDPMIRRFSVCAAAWGAAFLWTGAAFPQPGRGGINWSTANADPQRTAWIRTDPQISRESVQKGVVQFLWKLKLTTEPRQLNALTQPGVGGRLCRYKRFKDWVFGSGSGDRVFSIDHPTRKMVWEQRLRHASTYPQQKGGTWNCPGGLTASMSLGLGGPP